MAGKSKRNGSHSSRRPKTLSNQSYDRLQAAGDGPQGHLGVKSGPYAVTDSKLMSQYMVQDHMAAHYRNLNNAKPCVDATPPKTWLASQKVRDRMRREALQMEMYRRDKWMKDNQYVNDSMSADDDSYDEIVNMYKEQEQLALDAVDGGIKQEFASPAARGNRQRPASARAVLGTAEPGAKEMAFVDQVVNDPVQSPSKYHNPHQVKSNIPARGQTMRPSSARLAKREDNPYLGMTYGYGTRVKVKATTPRNKPSDLLDKASHKFTEGKPFQPRLLRTSKTSVIKNSKDYNPVKRDTNDSNKPSAPLTKEAIAKNQKMMAMKKGGGEPRMSVRTAASMRSRPMTAMTEGSNDWMNETLMSRDLKQNHSPTGVPPLDISLDRDNLVWLKEQSRQAQIRRAALSTNQHSRTSMRRDEDDAISTEHIDPETTVKQHRTQTYPNLTSTMSKEEELKYLEFITEVTNDVLDRGIFTNRVLKKVFNSHIQSHKSTLSVHLMKVKLEELRQELGIPHSDDSDDEHVGMTTIRPESPDDRSTVYSNADRVNTDEFTKTVTIQEQSDTYSKPKRHGKADYMHTMQHRPNLPLLKQTKKGRPPLPVQKNHVTGQYDSNGRATPEEPDRENAHNNHTQFRVANGNENGSTNVYATYDEVDAGDAEVKQPVAISLPASEHSSNVSLHSVIEDYAGSKASVDSALDRAGSASSLRSVGQNISRASSIHSAASTVPSQQKFAEQEDPPSSPKVSSRLSTSRYGTSESAGAMATVTPMTATDEDDDRNDDGGDDSRDVVDDNGDDHVADAADEYGGGDADDDDDDDDSVLGEPQSVAKDMTVSSRHIDSVDEEDPLELYKKTLAMEQDDELSDSNSGTVVDDFAQDEDQVFTPSAPPTPAKRTARSITQVSSIDASQVSDDMTSVSSARQTPQPTPRKRSSISIPPEVTPRADSRVTEESESVAVSELEDGNDF